MRRTRLGAWTTLFKGSQVCLGEKHNSEVDSGLAGRCIEERTEAKEEGGRRKERKSRKLDTKGDACKRASWAQRLPQSTGPSEASTVQGAIGTSTRNTAYDK